MVNMRNVRNNTHAVVMCYQLLLKVKTVCEPVAPVAQVYNCNNNNEGISRAPFHVKHAQLC